MARGIIPFGYTTKDGTITINPEEAKQIQNLCKVYLSGKALVGAAKTVGLSMPHGQVKQTMLNSRYLGSDVYPAILTKETQDAVRAELQRRAEKGGRLNRKRVVEHVPIPTAFYMKKRMATYQDPFRQAEYLYSLIESEESTWQL